MLPLAWRWRLSLTAQAQGAVDLTDRIARRGAPRLRVLDARAHIPSPGIDFRFLEKAPRLEWLTVRGVYEPTVNSRHIWACEQLRLLKLEGDLREAHVGRLVELRELDLFDRFKVVTGLCELRRLTRFHMKSIYNRDASLFDDLAQLTRLQSVDVALGAIGDLTWVGELNELVELAVDVPRPVPSLAPLAGCSELRFLIVPPPADGDLRCLLDLPALRHVVIRGPLTRVDESVLDELRRRGLYVSVDRERRPSRDVSPW